MNNRQHESGGDSPESKIEISDHWVIDGSALSLMGLYCTTDRISIEEQPIVKDTDVRPLSIYL